MFDLFLSQRLSIRIFRHLALFFSMILLFSWVAWSGSGKDGTFLSDLFMVIINAFFFFGYAYLTVYLLIPYFLTRKKVFLFIMLFIVAGLVLSALKFLFSDFVFYHAIASIESTSIGERSFSTLLVNTKDMTFIVALFALAKYTRDQYLVESNIRELQSRRMEAELRLIEHHLDPHVIFNNFNSLYSISINRPDFLVPTIRKLRTLLHYLFAESKSQLVLLSKEIEMIENYIGLEQLRFGDRLKVNYQREGTPGTLQIAPLILYSFVENCFVYGAGEDPSRSWISVEVQILETRLCFRASNSIPPFESDRKEGGKTGTINNSVRRLEILYPQRHRLTIREKRNEHHVELFISL